jgi:MFS family permease
VINVWAADAPKLGDKVPEFPSLYDWLQALPGSFEAQLFIGLMLAGTIGMIAHYALKWARGEVRGNLICYLWENKRPTALSFFTYIGVAVGAIVGGAFVTDFGVFVGWKMVFWLGITNGFTIDAIANKTQRAEWSHVERAVKRKAVT